MRKTLLAALLVSILSNSVCPQKRSTIVGDAWVGVVVSTNDASREITLSHPDKNKTETFVGILKEGYKVTLKDGSLYELKVSEIRIGERVRVFYKTQTQESGGQKVKVKSIHRLDFLGADEYTILRDKLALPPSIPVVLAESGRLPATRPLKIYLSIEQPYVKDRFVNWVGQWNKEQSAKYGPLEIVSDPAQSDLSLVVFWGSDETVILFPLMLSDQSGTTHTLFQATAYLTTKDDEGLKVLWLKRLALSKQKPKAQEGQIEKEIARRLKATAKK
jgi:hypothetical protein